MTTNSAMRGRHVCSWCDCVKSHRSRSSLCRRLLTSQATRLAQTSTPSYVSVAVMPSATMTTSSPRSGPCSLAIAVAVDDSSERCESVGDAAPSSPLSTDVWSASANVASVAMSTRACPFPHAAISSFFAASRCAARPARQLPASIEAHPTARG